MKQGLRIKHRLSVLLDREVLPFSIPHFWSLFIPSSSFNAAKRPEIRTLCKLLHLESIESNAYTIVQSNVQAYFMQCEVEAFLCNIEQAPGKTTANVPDSSKLSVTGFDSAASD